jgi:hypothetical protein
MSGANSRSAWRVLVVSLVGAAAAALGGCGPDAKERDLAMASILSHFPRGILGHVQSNLTNRDAVDAARGREEAAQWARDYLRRTTAPKMTPFTRTFANDGPEIELPRAPAAPRPDRPIHKLLSDLVQAAAVSLGEKLSGENAAVVLGDQSREPPFGTEPSDALRQAVADQMAVYKVRCRVASANEWADAISTGWAGPRPVVVLVKFAGPGGRPTTRASGGEYTNIYTTTFSRWDPAARAQRELVTISQRIEWRPSGEATVSAPTISSP